MKKIFTLLFAACCFTAMSQAPSVPLQLVSFKAMLTAEGAKLDWNAVTETSVKNLTVERSTNGKDYAAIGTLNVQNSSNAAYNFTDKVPYEGINYYRLKMNDMNGSAKYSPVASVVNRPIIKAIVFPNPANGTITVSHNKAIVGATITITTIGGQPVKTINLQPGAVQTQIAIDELARGHYVVTYNNEGQKAVTKFMKQ